MASTKPSWQKLTWFKAKRVWRKYRDGKTYYLGVTGVNKDRESHALALAEWERIEADLKRPTVEHARKIAELKIAGWTEHDIDEAMKVSGSLDFASFMAITAPKILKGTSNQNTRTVKGLVAGFLDAFRADVKFVARSTARYESLRCHLQHFTAWFGADRLVDEINGETLTKYWAKQAESIESSEIRHYTGRDRVAALRQFIRWLWRVEIIPQLPRNIDDRRLAISPPLTKPGHFSVDQLKALIDHSSGRTRLYVLLALNTGATQIDIANLKRDEIDLKLGVIRRKRSKTKRHANIPEVTYRLWKPTIELLKEHMAGRGDLALTNLNHEPLVVSAIGANDKATHKDNVRSAFIRVVNKINKAQVDLDVKRTCEPITPTFKRLRATAANLIEQNASFNGVASYFLCHSPGSMRERHYTAGNDVELARALDWLGATIGLETQTAPTQGSLD